MTSRATVQWVPLPSPLPSITIIRPGNKTITKSNLSFAKLNLPLPPTRRNYREVHVVKKNVIVDSVSILNNFTISTGNFEQLRKSQQFNHGLNIPNSNPFTDCDSVY